MSTKILLAITASIAIAFSAYSFYEHQRDNYIYHIGDVLLYTFLIEFGWFAANLLGLFFLKNLATKTNSPLKVLSALFFIAAFFAQLLFGISMLNVVGGSMAG